MVNFLSFYVDFAKRLENSWSREVLFTGKLIHIRSIYTHKKINPHAMVLPNISHQSAIGMNQKSTFCILICSVAGWQAQIYSFVVKTYKNVFTTSSSDLYCGWFQPLIWLKYSFITRLLSYSYRISIYFLFFIFFCSYSSSWILLLVFWLLFLRLFIL